MITLKVGQMPGQLRDVVANEGMTAREILALAGLEASNHEIRLDGDKISLDTTIHGGRLLVMMKMIKGNMPTIKVGQMPGMLRDVEYTEGETASQIFDRAGVSISGSEVRIDGDKITPDTQITNGRLLVAMKMIKGNAEVWVAKDMQETDIKILLGAQLPVKIYKSEVSDIGDNMLLVMDCIVEADMFNSVYTLEEEVETPVTINMNEVVDGAFVMPVEETHECKCVDTKNKVIKIVKERLVSLESMLRYDEKKLRQAQVEVDKSNARIFEMKEMLLALEQQL